MHDHPYAVVSLFDERDVCLKGNALAYFRRVSVRTAPILQTIKAAAVNPSIKLDVHGIIERYRILSNRRQAAECFAAFRKQVLRENRADLKKKFAGRKFTMPCFKIVDCTSAEDKDFSNHPTAVFGVKDHWMPLLPMDQYANQEDFNVKYNALTGLLGEYETVREKNLAEFIDRIEITKHLNKERNEWQAEKNRLEDEQNRLEAERLEAEQQSLEAEQNLSETSQLRSEAMQLCSEYEQARTETE